MKIDKKQLPKSQIEFTVEMSPDELAPYVERATQKISQEKPIEGFRPGKAPSEIIKQRFGEMTIFGEAADIAIPEKLWQIVRDEKLEIVAQPAVDIVKLAPGNAFVWKAVLTLAPQVTKVADYHATKIKKAEVKIEDQAVEKLLRELQTFRAKETLEDKAIAKGDKVEVDYDISIDRVAIENGLAKKYPIIVGDNHFVPGFEDQLLGLKRGETKEFKLTFPKTYYQKNLAGREADFKVTIGNVYKRNLPELNDDFAKSLGQFTKLDELKTQIRENLLVEETQKEDRKIETELFDQLIAGSRFEDIPDELVHSEADKMVHELEHNITSQGLSFDDYLQSLKKTHDQLLLDFTPSAVKRIKAALLMKEIAKTENIQAEEKEINEEIETILKHYPNDSAVEAKVKSVAYREFVSDSIKNKKTLELLKLIALGK